MVTWHPSLYLSPTSMSLHVCLPSSIPHSISHWAFLCVFELLSLYRFSSKFQGSVSEESLGIFPPQYLRSSMKEVKWLCRGMGWAHSHRQITGQCPSLRSIPTAYCFMVLIFLGSWGGGLDSYRGHTWDSLIGLHLHQLKLYLFSWGGKSGLTNLRQVELSSESRICLWPCMVEGSAQNPRKQLLPQIMHSPWRLSLHDHASESRNEWLALPTF